MSLHPHQHRELVTWLIDNHNGRTADEVFSILNTDRNLGGLRALSFMTAERFSRISLKRRMPNFVVVPDEEAEAFPGGIPGFPNKLRRTDFDRAWEEVSSG